MPHEDSELFEVSYSTAVRHKLEEVFREAAPLQLRQRIAAAARTIDRRLRTAARDSGEPVYELPDLPLIVHHAAMPPLSLHFGIHLRLPHVFVSEIRLMSTD
jgi:hypothetical protein